MDFIKRNKLALLTATIVGLIYIIPHVTFILSLGDEYKGIPIQYSDEYFYSARIQEILDGHFSVGSFSLFEYKNQAPLSPPTGEFFYAIPSMILGVSLFNVLLLSRFFLPFVLFLLIYFLVRLLTVNKESLLNKTCPDLGRRINAVAGALFVTLGYDLVDYGTVFGYIKGLSSPSSFLIWARPVNPILGIIFLTAFLVLIWHIVETKGTKKQKFYKTGASVFLALMIASYFFSWGIALSVVAVLVLIYLLKKEYRTVKDLMMTIALGFLLSAPYWYSVWKTKQSVWYEYSVLRSGLFYTHFPLINKFTIMVLVVFVFLILFSRSRLKDFKNWHWFSLSFIFGSLLVFSQQIITGMTIWPYHFVRYTIPLGIIVLIVLFYNILKQRSEILWKAGICVIIFSSLFFGIYTQINAYKSLHFRFSNLQIYAPLFDWVNQQEKDCVILVKEQPKDVPTLGSLILSFTHCNIYDTTGTGTLVPKDRVYHNFLVHSVFNGTTAGARHYLFSNWKELFGVKDFSDVPNNLEEKIQLAQKDYGEFLKKDLRSELEKYRLDYIVIEGEIGGSANELLKELDLVYSLNNISVYGFSL